MDLCHLATTTQRARLSINVGRWHGEDRCTSLVLTWMLDITKLAQRGTRFRVSCRWPRADVSLSFSLPCCMVVCHMCGRGTRLMQVWKRESICLPPVPTEPHFVCLWAMFRAGSSQFVRLGDKAATQVFSVFSLFYFSCLQVMSCLLGIKLHTYPHRPPIPSCLLSV